MLIHRNTNFMLAPMLYSLDCHQHSDIFTFMIRPSFSLLGAACTTFLLFVLQVGFGCTAVFSTSKYSLSIAYASETIDYCSLLPPFIMSMTSDICCMFMPM